MSKCECTMAIRVNGDGCRYCQPQGCIDRLIDWVNEAKEEIVALAKERKDLECQLSAAEAKLPRWIPVIERLPTSNGDYLISTETIVTEVEFYEDWFYEYVGSNSVPVLGVIAWMELPKSYKPECPVQKQA